MEEVKITKEKLDDLMTCLTHLLSRSEKRVKDSEVEARVIRTIIDTISTNQEDQVDVPVEIKKEVTREDKIILFISRGQFEDSKSIAKHLGEDVLKVRPHLSALVRREVIKSVKLEHMNYSLYGIPEYFDENGNPIDVRVPSYAKRTILDTRGKVALEQFEEQVVPSNDPKDMRISNFDPDVYKETFEPKRDEPPKKIDRTMAGPVVKPVTSKIVDFEPPKAAVTKRPPMPKSEKEIKKLPGSTGPAYELFGYVKESMGIEIIIHLHNPKYFGKTTDVFNDRNFKTFYYEKEAKKAINFKASSISYDGDLIVRTSESLPDINKDEEVFIEIKRKK